MRALNEQLMYGKLMRHRGGRFCNVVTVTRIVVVISQGQQEGRSDDVNFNLFPTDSVKTHV